MKDSEDIRRFNELMDEYTALKTESDEYKRQTALSAAVEGGGLGDIGGDLAGLLAWCAVAFALSTRTFKWE